MWVGHARLRMFSASWGIHEKTGQNSEDIDARWRGRPGLYFCHWVWCHDSPRMFLFSLCKNCPLWGCLLHCTGTELPSTAMRPDVQKAGLWVTVTHRKQFIRTHQRVTLAMGDIIPSLSQRELVRPRIRAFVPSSRLGKRENTVDITQMTDQRLSKT